MPMSEYNTTTYTSYVPYHI
uniref:Uncharacterized protein n=1 Tax=Arundo donax TaxID=35708 RepID=A0A0A9AVP5_ARUDO